MKNIKQAINGIEYRKQIPNDILNDAVAKNYVIIYGASDDLLYIEGVSSGELGAWNGFNYEDYSQEDDQDGVYDLVQKLKLEAVWCPDNEKSWLIKIGSDHKSEPYNIMEDGEVFCQGLIVEM